MSSVQVLHYDFHISRGGTHVYYLLVSIGIQAFPALTPSVRLFFTNEVTIVGARARNLYRLQKQTVT
jgi:hypothetical protein